MINIGNTKISINNLNLQIAVLKSFFSLPDKGRVNEDLLHRFHFPGDACTPAANGSTSY